VNAKKEFQKRSKCQAVVNIEAQSSLTHWVGAGEASLWTYDAIHDFSNFIFDMYTNKLSILQIKFAHKTCVVDMSLFWLW
jgi:hypothetical protein